MKLENNYVTDVSLKGNRDNENKPELVTSYTLTVDFVPFLENGHEEVLNIFNQLIEIQAKHSSKP